MGLGWLLLSYLAVGAPDIVVAPDGNDLGPGTAQDPFATPARAQLAARERLARQPAVEVTVELRAGTYALAEPLRCTAADNRTTWAAAAGARVVFSGGRRIAGWRRGEGGVWSAPVPKGWAFRQLVVNGTPAQRAQYPNTGWLRLRAATLSEDRASYTVDLAPGEVKRWPGWQEAELVACGNWEINRKRLSAIDEATGRVTLLPPHSGGHDALRPGPGRPCRFEGAVSFVDQPGEWAVDPAAGQVSYLPRPGEDLTTAEVIAPRLTRLVELNGTKEAPVRLLRFSGITFAHADWAFPEYGFSGIQAGWHTWPAPGQKGWAWDQWKCIEPAVSAEYAEDCSFRDGAFLWLGGVAVRLGRACHGSVVEGNRVRWVGSNGIMVGHDAWDADSPDDVPRNVLVANNHVSECGLADWGAVGIWASFCGGLKVSHNLVHGLPYSGISVGWQWNDKPTGARNNIVEANHVYDVMNRLCDGGCLYTLGLQPGSEVVGNLFHDARRSDFAQGAPNNGIFFDEGSTGWHVEGNLIYNTSAEPIRFNASGHDRMTWGENTLGMTRMAPGRRGLALACDGAAGLTEPHRDALEPASLTAEAWVWVDALPGGEDPRRWIVSKNDNEWADGHWALMLQDDRVGAYLNIGGGQAKMLDAWSQAGLLKTGVWQHLALTYDAKDLVVYLDGAEVARGAIGKPRTQGRGPFAIGGRPDRYIGLHGRVDEVRVYGEALSAAQVRARYVAAGADAPGDRPTVGRWSFDEQADAAAKLAAMELSAGLEPRYRARLGD